eukprot:gene10678-biopygen7705
MASPASTPPSPSTAAWWGSLLCERRRSRNRTLCSCGASTPFSWPRTHGGLGGRPCGSRGAFGRGPSPGGARHGGRGRPRFTGLRGPQLLHGACRRPWRPEAHYSSIRFVTGGLPALGELRGGPLHRVEEGTEAIWAAAAKHPTDRIEWVLVFQNAHPEKDAQGQLLPLDPHAPGHQNMHVDRLSSRHISTTATGPLWIQDLLRPQLEGIRHSTGDPQSATEAQRHTLQHRTIGHVAPAYAQHMAHPPQAQHLLLGPPASACKLIPWHFPNQQEPCRWCGAAVPPPWRQARRHRRLRRMRSASQRNHPQTAPR